MSHKDEAEMLLDLIEAQKARFEIVKVELEAMVKAIQELSDALSVPMPPENGLLAALGIGEEQ